MLWNWNSIGITYVTVERYLFLSFFVFEMGIVSGRHFLAEESFCGGKGCGGVCCGGKHLWWECVRWLAKALVGNFDSTCQLLLGT